ncbi:hypothetical protein RchiOBHm_Chr5g0045891 [Rosa chinensis]|uniref:Uncharacterized protein n=1 Tax=Rosa chinensis TaxID=74649 RepID=A0A2P6QDY9_ROSCH|nr:hypothetical protein RchiOBHm_Chr5g0045891 [Rosa chinensis]
MRAVASGRMLGDATASSFKHKDLPNDGVAAALTAVPSVVDIEAATDGGATARHRWMPGSPWVSKAILKEAQRERESGRRERERVWRKKNRNYIK